MARARSAGLALVIGTEYNDKDIRNLQRDLDKLKTKSKAAQGTFGKLGSSLKANAGPALAAAGAAAGAMAIALGVDAVKAAAEEEKQLANLGLTLKNLGIAFNMDELDAFITRMQFATGVSDNELRASLTTLARSTRDLGEAQQLLSLALDVSAGSGKSLSTVTTAMSKAAAGNFSALKRLVPTIDQTAIAQKDLNGVVKSLSDQFGGSAATAAATYSGQLAILTEVAGEVQEAFGAGFLAGFFGTTDAVSYTSDQVKQLQDDMKTLGEVTGQLAAVLGTLGIIWSKTVGAFLDALAWRNSTDEAVTGLQRVIGTLVSSIPVFGQVTTALMTIAGILKSTSDDSDTFTTALNDASQASLNFADVLGTTAPAVDAYGAALGLQPGRFATVIQGLVDAAKGVQDAADQASADGASAAAEAARQLAERTKKRTDQILADLRSNIEKAKAASDEFASIRRGYVQAAREDAAITTFAPEGKITSRGIEANIRQRLGLIKRFANAIKGLQGTLNGAALSDIIAQGPIAGLPYAEALLKDTASVGRINELQSQLATPTATIGRIGAELATGTTAAKLAAAETFTNKYVVGKDAINITVNGELTAGQRRQLKQAVRDALSGIGREGKNGKATNIK